ncbi:MAG: SDR family oxidoreductase [Candidatus Magasanikbacteria bacterium]|nr:SDR family oxidoreductase [Candidatus Magasanikbacteria bacterium]
MKPQTSHTVLITGASTGIGYELAKLFARDKYNLVLIARNEERLEKVALELKNSYGIEVIHIGTDLAIPHAPQDIFHKLREKEITIDILVNNAGVGVYGNFAETDLNKEINMIDLNISSLVKMTKLFLPQMEIKRHGRILNVASLAGFMPGPGMAVYYASKAFVLHFSEALTKELKDSGITVTALCPGPTKTEFEKNADFSFSHALHRMDAQTVAQIGYTALMKSTPVIIPGFRNKIFPLLIRFSPRRFVTYIVHKMQ